MTEWTWPEWRFVYCLTKKGAPLYISSVTVAFLSFNNAQLFPRKFQVPWTGDFCIIMFLPNSDLCFPSPAHKGLITYCQLWGKPQSSTVAQQIGLCWLMARLAVRFALVQQEQQQKALWELHPTEGRKVKEWKRASTISFFSCPFDFPISGRETVWRMSLLSCYC